MLPLFSGIFTLYSALLCRSLQLFADAEYHQNGKPILPISVCIEVFP